MPARHPGENIPLVSSKWALHKPAGQALVLGGALMATPANQVRAFNYVWNYGGKAISAYTALEPAYTAYKADMKLTVGYGHKGSMPLRMVPGIGWYYGKGSLAAGAGKLQVPTFGFGLTSKKVNESSRGGSATTSTSMHESAPSASKLRRMRNRVRYQNRKRRSYRCKKVSRGRRCKLSRGHSGRHSYV